MSIIDANLLEESKEAVKNAVERGKSNGYKDGYSNGFEDGKKLGDYGEGYEAGIEAGKASMIDESKIIEKTAQGTGIVSLDDVSELPHDISVQLTGENVGGKEVKVFGKNLFDNDISNIKEVTYIGLSHTTESKRIGYEIHLPNGTYVIHTLLKDGKTGGDYIYGCVVNADNKFVQSVNTFIELNSNAGTQPVIFDIKDGYVLKVYNGIASTTITNAQNIFKKYNIQIENEIKTPFEPYIAPTSYTADADGKVNIKSISPNMTIVCEDTNISVSYRANWSIIDQRQKVWNDVNFNKRADHEKCYAYGWSDDTFRPITDLIVQKGDMMFIASKIVNLAGCFKKYDTKLNTSKASTLYYAFQNCVTQYLPQISLEGITSGTTGTSYTFASPNIRRIEEVIFKDDGTTPIATNMFTGANNLEEIRTGGTIGQNINFGVCPLSRASIDNIFEHLKAPEYTLTATSNRSWGVSADGTYPMDKIVVKWNGELPDNITDYSVYWEAGNDYGNSGFQYTHFEKTGEVEFTSAYFDTDENGYFSIYGVSDSESGNDIDTSFYTVYEAVLNTSALTATFNKAAVNKAYEKSEGANDGSTSYLWRDRLNTRPNWTVELK